MISAITTMWLSHEGDEMVPDGYMDAEHKAREKCAKIISQVAGAGLSGAALGFVAMVMPYELYTASYTQIATDLGISRRRAIGAVHDLLVTGIIDVWKAGEVLGSNSNTYWLSSLPMGCGSGYVETLPNATAARIFYVEPEPDVYLDFDFGDLLAES